MQRLTAQRKASTNGLISKYYPYFLLFAYRPLSLYINFQADLFIVRPVILHRRRINRTNKRFDVPFHTLPKAFTVPSLELFRQWLLPKNG